MSWRMWNAIKPKRTKVFGGFVKMRRQTLGLKQRQIAKALGYQDPAMVSDLETGKALCPEKKLAPLAELIGVNTFDLKRIYDLDIEIRAAREARK